MKPIRLPPQPTDTALARLVQKIVDSMPWIMARNLRNARVEIGRLRSEISRVHEENYHLHKDYRTLFHGASAVAPIPDEVRVKVWDEDWSMDRVLGMSVNYRPMKTCIGFSAFGARHMWISEIGAEAVRRAATEIAREAVDQHRDHLIACALRGKTLAEIIKP